MKASLIKLFDLRLSKLIQEIGLYSDEKLLWRTPKGINNSAGNLTLHLIGNLNHFIGAVLGNDGYQRERDKEFSLKAIPVLELQQQIEATRKIVKKAINNLTQDDFDAIYPINVFGTEMTTTYFLIHLTGHLNYHLGQINYHRRLVC
ncbi:MAG: DinB family protein [Flavobacteriaceae bacterium]